jgi:hypothetical protein
MLSPAVTVRQLHLPARLGPLATEASSHTLARCETHSCTRTSAAAEPANRHGHYQGEPREPREVLDTLGGNS